jgi:hypothetical protein
VLAQDWADDQHGESGATGPFARAAIARPTALMKGKEGASALTGNQVVRFENVLPRPALWHGTGDPPGSRFQHRTAFVSVPDGLPSGPARRRCFASC